MGHGEYPKTVQVAVDFMRQMKNTRNNILGENKYDNCNRNSNQDNYNTSNG